MWGSEERCVRGGGPLRHFPCLMVQKAAWRSLGQAKFTTTAHTHHLFFSVKWRKVLKSNWKLPIPPLSLCQDTDHLSLVGLECVATQFRPFACLQFAYTLMSTFRGRYNEREWHLGCFRLRVSLPPWQVTLTWRMDKVASHSSFYMFCFPCLSFHDGSGTWQFSKIFLVPSKRGSTTSNTVSRDQLFTCRNVVHSRKKWCL